MPDYMSPALPQNLSGVSGQMNLPSFNLQPTPNITGADFSSLLRLLSQPQQSLTNTAIPAIANQFSSSGKFLQPAISAIRETTAGNVAAAQSDAMKRGLTGSDIEAAGMQGARQAGSAQEAQLTGQFGLQQAQTLAKMIMESMGFDIQANSQMFQNLAQAIGQQMSNQLSLEMLQKQIDAGMSEASAANKAALWGAGIGAAGDIAGGYLKRGK